MRAGFGKIGTFACSRPIVCADKGKEAYPLGMMRSPSPFRKGRSAPSRNAHFLISSAQSAATIPSSPAPECEIPFPLRNVAAVPEDAWYSALLYRVAIRSARQLQSGFPERSKRTSGSTRYKNSSSGGEWTATISERGYSPSSLSPRVLTMLSSSALSLLTRTSLPMPSERRHAAASLAIDVVPMIPAESEWRSSCRSSPQRRPCLESSAAMRSVRSSSGNYQQSGREPQQSVLAPQPHLGMRLACGGEHNAVRGVERGECAMRMGPSAQREALAARVFDSLQLSLKGHGAARASGILAWEIHMRDRGWGLFRKSGQQGEIHLQRVADAGGRGRSLHE